VILNYLLIFLHLGLFLKNKICTALQLRKAIEDTNSGTKLGHQKRTVFRSPAMESLLSNRPMDNDLDV